MNIKTIKELFLECETNEEMYQKIILFGKSLPPFPAQLKTHDTLVKGCQSLLYLDTSLTLEGNLTFLADSNALISKGLAALLITLYDNTSPEIVLKNPPLILDELGIPGLLSPSRTNGLQSLYLKMKQSALQALVR